MKKLGSNGLEDLKQTEIKEGHTYFMGASSSPKLVYVEEVKSSEIKYRVHPYYPENTQTERRKIFEDLVATATETMKNSRRSDFIGKDTNLKEIQRSRIKFKIKDKVAKQMSNPAMEIEQKYRRKYGLETNLGLGNHTYETRVNKSDVSKIRDLPEIRVLESRKP